MPNDEFCDIVNWYKDVLDMLFSADCNKSREAMLKEISHFLPHNTFAKLMSFLVPVQLLGFHDKVYLVCFDIVDLINSMLTNEKQHEAKRISSYQ